MNWLERMNWSFLETDEAEAVWENARQRYFDGDEPLDRAFREALREQGWDVEDD